MAHILRNALFITFFYHMQHMSYDKEHQEPNLSKCNDTQIFTRENSIRIQVRDPEQADIKTMEQLEQW